MHDSMCVRASCLSQGRLDDVWLCWLLAESALIYLGPSIQGLIKLKDEHPSVPEVGNEVLSPSDLLRPPTVPVGGEASLVHIQPCDACRESQPNRQPLTLWVPSRASCLSWVQLARCQASIYVNITHRLIKY